MLKVDCNVLKNNDLVKVNKGPVEVLNGLKPDVHDGRCVMEVDLRVCKFDGIVVGAHSVVHLENSLGVDAVGRVQPSGASNEC